MTYPENCYFNLLGIRGICEPPSPNPALYFLDDVPGVNLTKLAELADQDAATGAKLGEKLIESACRFLVADVAAVYDGRYTVENMLVNGCSTCRFLATYAGGVERGVVVKDNTESSFSSLVIDKITAKINATGTYHVVIDDGVETLVIEHDFLPGVEYNFTNVGYETRQKTVRIYMQEDVPLAQLACGGGSGGGCGCSGKKAAISDLIYGGTFNGADVSQAYGFVPCAFIRCNSDDLLCFLAKSSPRMLGLALLWKTAELYYQHNLESIRNNRVANANADDLKENVKKYGKLYLDKLNGTGGQGVKDLVFNSLKTVNDTCVVCNSLLSTAWATG